jgi:hypothetical protein
MIECAVWRRLRNGPHGQPEGRGEEDAEGPPAHQNDRLVMLRSHWLLESWFTLSGVEAAHERHPRPV